MSDLLEVLAFVIFVGFCFLIGSGTVGLMIDKFTGINECTPPVIEEVVKISQAKVLCPSFDYKGTCEIKDNFVTCKCE